MSNKHKQLITQTQLGQLPNEYKQLLSIMEIIDAQIQEMKEIQEELHDIIMQKLDDSV